MIYIRDVNGNYPLSKDYEKLWRLSLESSIVCIVDYDKTLRDIAQTVRVDQLTQVCVRGTCYIHAHGPEDFRNQCEKSRLEFIDPDAFSGSTTSV